MSGKKAEWVYDELLCFLGSPFFQAPVLGFIENNCLIFDPSVEDSNEYKKVHKEYKKIIDTLLDAFCKDTKLSHDEVIKALNDMNAKKDLREVFQGLFELVLSVDDLDIFVQLMTQKNIELQQQALILIIKTTGSLPDSLTEGPGKGPPAPASAAEDEDEIMKRVLELSKKEYEDEQKRQRSVEKRDKQQVEKMLALSQHEVHELEGKRVEERHKMNVAMATMSIQDLPPLPSQDKGRPAQESPVGATSKSAPAPKAPSPQKPAVPKPQVPVIKTPGVQEPSKPEFSQTRLGPGLEPKSKMPPISGSQAAANWLQSAQQETQSGPSDAAVQRAAAAMAGMSAEELKKRQEYLRQQRDKLIAMKQKEREKQLLSAEQSNPGRPISAQAARRSLQGEETGDTAGKQLSAEEQKKIDMRRTIASKLKAELMGGN